MYAEAAAKLATNNCGSQESSQVRLLIEKTSWSSRKLFASVNIAASAEQVWQCLNDYEGLASFIPSLVENRCLEKKENGAVIYQVRACVLTQEQDHSDCLAALLMHPPGLGELKPRL